MKNYQKLMMTIALSAAALTGFTACNSMKSNQDPAQAQDGHITSEVKGALRSNPVYKFRNVQVATAYGKVQLSGFTSDPKEKQAAEQLARKVDGVKDVTNGIMVQQ